jgi:DNA end-binding protein Ku
MAASATRILWKGAISFGLVHIPIALHPATAQGRLDFDWLDKRSMDPVGYKRINKTTGKEIAKENIVKGIEYDDDQYVVLSPEEIAAAYPKTTQTVEIQAFVPISQIPFVYLDRPYYVSPINKGAKVFALLREVLHKTKKVGIAKVVIQTRQHLAVLMACGPALVLNLLRWDDEIRPWDGLDLPAQGTRSTGLTDKEMAMGEQLVKDMSSKWKPGDFTDSFKEQILKLVKEKVEAGETAAVTQPEAEESIATGAKIYDLTEMLQRSLGKGTRTPPAASKAKPTKKKTAGRSAKGTATQKTPAKPARKAVRKAVRKAAGAPAKAAEAGTKKKGPARKTATPGKTAGKRKAA